ncbi:MAG: hypothetical protein IPH89_00585 [Bacteroidetes bacterium]|nr:hypothetical protein [Bacteroidota bacterium]
MIIFKKALKLVGIILIFFLIQTITFLTIGPKQLKNKLLPESLIHNLFDSDSAFVRDYYTTDCITGDFYVFSHSLNLKNQAEVLKEKLGVKYIYFADRKISNCEDPTPAKYPLVYEANALSGNWQSLFGLYDCKLDEFFRIKKGKHDIIIQRETNYRWCFLFWIQTYEYCDSWELS